MPSLVLSCRVFVFVWSALRLSLDLVRLEDVLLQRQNHSLLSIINRWEDPRSYFLLRSHLSVCPFPSLPFLSLYLTQGQHPSSFPSVCLSVLPFLPLSVSAVVTSVDSVGSHGTCPLLPSFSFSVCCCVLVCMYVCMYVCVYVCMYAFMCVLFQYMCVCVCARACVYMHARCCSCMCTCTSVCASNT